MSDAIRPTDGNTSGKTDGKTDDRTDDNKNAERADRRGMTDKTADGRTDGGITTDGKTADRAATAPTPFPSPSSRETGAAIPTPRASDTTTSSPRESTAGTDRTADRPEPSARPVHAPEPAPGIGSGAAADNGRHVPQGVENGSLMPHDESDKFSLRLQHAVTGFVDEPRSAVEEADHVLEEVAARFTEAVTKRRATLHGSWETKGSDDTEKLRLALRDYRELAERLLHI